MRSGSSSGRGGNSLSTSAPTKDSGAANGANNSSIGRMQRKQRQRDARGTPTGEAHGRLGDRP